MNKLKRKLAAVFLSLSVLIGVGAVNVAPAGAAHSYGHYWNQWVQSASGSYNISIGDYGNAWHIVSDWHDGSGYLGTSNNFWIEKGHGSVVEIRSGNYWTGIQADFTICPVWPSWDLDGYSGEQWVLRHPSNPGGFWMHGVATFRYGSYAVSSGYYWQQTGGDQCQRVQLP